jgi:N-acetyl-1-D-myo-inositol-2-amino-2-deoxy-alpha-D-glucopyranoside deacetylase
MKSLTRFSIPYNDIRAFVFTVVIAAGLSVPTSALAQNTPRTLVAVLAHPDDEGPAGPVLARYAREGVQVHLIVVSNGQQGTGANPEFLRSESITAGDALGNMRAEEARCSATALGANPPILLGFPDGKLGDFISDRTLVYRMTDRIAAEIQRLHPDALITWGPEGGTGHPDHRIVSALVSQLVRAGALGATERLFYMYIPAEGMVAMNPQRGAPPMLVPAAKYLSTIVPFTRADLDAAKRSMACHRSQYSTELIERIFPMQARSWNGNVTFAPAYPAYAGMDLFK